MRSRDTNAAAHRVQIEALRRLGPEGRLALGLRMSDDARRIALERERARHPTWSELEIKRAVLRRVYGDALVDRVWPAEADR